ncbi:RNA polymerase sigma factor [Corynebacterium cystitidis]|uniref:RNA polymerase sigma factor n=1 Tax=Corynebacterium cystitidis TaxID=35757 RepID=UPI00211DB1AE|nr:sigma factor [Corynebacterium cystitidis]
MFRRRIGCTEAIRSGDCQDLSGFGRLKHVCSENLSYVGSRAGTEDLTQETLFTLFTKTPCFNDEEHEKALVLRVAINKCKEHLRKHARLEPLDEQELAVRQPVGN